MGQAATKQEEFWEACSFGRNWLVKKMIDEGIDVNWISHIHASRPLHVASQGNPKIVKMLLDAGAQVDAVDENGNTALHHASMRGHCDCSRLLLDAGANVNAVNKSDWTPLINACYWTQPEQVRLLLNCNANCLMKNKEGRTSLHELCRAKASEEEKLMEIFELLRECDMDLNERSENDNPWDSEADFCPLMFACYHNHPLVAERLLQCGVNVNAQDRNGWTALHWSVSQRFIPVIILLLSYGADRDVKNNREETPFELVDEEDDELIDVLCQQPTPRFPVIVSNGYVTTEDEGETSDDGEVKAVEG